MTIKFSELQAIVNEHNALGNQAAALATIPQTDTSTGTVTFTVDGQPVTTTLPKYAIAPIVKACQTGKAAQLEALGVTPD